MKTSYKTPEATVTELMLEPVLKAVSGSGFEQYGNDGDNDNIGGWS